MRRLGVFREETWVSAVNWIGFPVTLIYLYCMVIHPLLVTAIPWSELQNIWDRWQTLNAGFLALISSIVAFNISRFKEEQQRKRQFTAARAFLPDAFSELSEYYRLSARFLTDAWSRLSTPSDSGYPTMQFHVPNLPVDYKETFRQCISFAEAEVADDLAKILVKMQVHHSRMKDLSSALSSSNGRVLGRRDLLYYFFQLGSLQAGINKNFDFARGEEIFNGSPLTWDDYKNAYSNLNIRFFNIDELEKFTQDKILRNAGA